MSIARASLQTNSSSQNESSSKPTIYINLITYRQIITNKRRIKYPDNEMFINKQQIAGILTSLSLVLLLLK